MHPQRVIPRLVRQHVGAHLASAVREVDPLAGLEHDAGHTAEAGPYELYVPVLARSARPVEPHCVTSVRGQVDAVVVLRERRRSLHSVDCSRGVEVVVTQRRHTRAHYGPLGQPLSCRHCVDTHDTKVSDLRGDLPDAAGS